MSDWCGAKIALLHGDELLVYLRDDFPTIVYPGMWDLPGGGREGEETPEACALRELEEEFGLTLPESRIEHGHSYICNCYKGVLQGWFFTGKLTAEEITAIEFGDEGQYWQMMKLQDYLTHPLAIPAFVTQLRRAFADRLQ